jgi:hypothetical protein
MVSMFLAPSGSGAIKLPASNPAPNPATQPDPMRLCGASPRLVVWRLLSWQMGPAPCPNVPMLGHSSRHVTAGFQARDWRKRQACWHGQIPGIHLIRCAPGWWASAYSFKGGLGVTLIWKRPTAPQVSQETPPSDPYHTCVTISSSGSVKVDGPEKHKTKQKEKDNRIRASGTEWDRTGSQIWGSTQTQGHRPLGPHTHTLGGKGPKRSGQGV